MFQIVLHTVIICVLVSYYLFSFLTSTLKRTASNMLFIILKMRFPNQGYTLLQQLLLLLTRDLREWTEEWSERCELIPNDPDVNFLKFQLVKVS